MFNMFLVVFIQPGQKGNGKGKKVWSLSLGWMLGTSTEVSMHMICDFFLNGHGLSQRFLREVLSLQDICFFFGVYEVTSITTTLALF